jgi:tetratricopeptide (TPR) repeat protein
MLTKSKIDIWGSIEIEINLKVLCACLLMTAISAGCTHYTSGQLVEKGFDESSSKKAITWYSRAIRKDSNNVEAYWRRADVYSRRKQYNKSIADLNHAIAIDSAFNVGYLFGDRGNALEETGDFSGPIRDYSIALKFCPPSTPTTPRENFYFYRSRTKLNIGDTTGALIDNDSAIFYWKDFVRARYQRGRIEVITGQFQKAIFDYQVSPLTPNAADDREFLADVFYYGYLKFKIGDTCYCSYWKAAAANGFPMASDFLIRYCSEK